MELYVITRSEPRHYRLPFCELSCRGPYLEAVCIGV